MRLRLVIAGFVLPLLGLVLGDEALPVLLVIGGICLLAGLIGYATQRD